MNWISMLAGRTRGIARIAGVLGTTLLAMPAWAQAPGGTSVAEKEAPGQSATELSKQLANPVSSIWSIANQINNYELSNGRWNNNWQFQPVLPVSLT
ncbi:MAG: hypothetical protein ACRD1B_09525, partial [Thermoanaerobaculia bacterium]